MSSVVSKFFKSGGFIGILVSFGFFFFRIIVEFGRIDGVVG